MSGALSWISNVWSGPKVDQQSQVLSAYRQLQSSDFGRIIIEDLARYCNLRNASFDPQSPHSTSFNEGQRDALLHLLEMCQIDPLVLTAGVFDEER